MPHPRVVAVRRQVADKKLREAVEAASRKFGVPFKTPATLPLRYPDLYGAELIESVAAFVEGITATQPQLQRKAS